MELCRAAVVFRYAPVALSEDFEKGVETLSQDTMLPLVELEILESLHEEGVPMRAGEIAALMNATHQLVGRRTSKLHEMRLVHKFSMEGISRSTITDKVRQRYFGMNAPSQLPLDNE